MNLRLRTIWEVRAFSITLTAIVIVGSLALQKLMIPPDIALRVRWPGVLISFILAAPLTYFIGLRLYHVHRLSADVQHASDRDTLTGLLTRNAFLTKVRSLAPLHGALIMADIDHFKRFNDTFGHAAGDSVLQKVAEVFTNQSRMEDFVARFGGEEFMIFLPETGLEDGIAVAERLRLGLGADRMMLKGELQSVSASFGVSVALGADHFDTAMAEADAALYEAKAQGRNRVVAAR